MIDLHDLGVLVDRARLAALAAVIDRDPEDEDEPEPEDESADEDPVGE